MRRATFLVVLALLVVAVEVGAVIVLASKIDSSGDTGPRGPARTGTAAPAATTPASPRGGRARPPR
jgi:hypothetical protein